MGAKSARWLAAITATMLLFVISNRSPAPPAVDFGAPDAAEQRAYARRVPTASGVDVAGLFDRAAQRVARLRLYASRVGRALPVSDRASRVWMSGGRVISLDARSSASALLDAWTPLGPGNIGGRTRIVRFHPAQPTTLFAAGVSGGVWRSDDSGGSWRPIAEGLSNIAVNAFAIDPRDPSRMYAGTGEGYFREEIRGTGLPLRGSGIFVTRNGGETWHRLPSTATPDFHWINDLALGVGDTRRIYAATRTGVWRSLDAGETWTNILAVSVRGGCLDLELRPDDSADVLFASCGSYEQATVYRFRAASRTADVDAVLSEPGMGRTSLAIAPSRPDVIYALSASNEPGAHGRYQQGLLAVFRSIRGGVAGSWQTRVNHHDPIQLNTLLLTNAFFAQAALCGFAPRNTFTNMGWYTNVIAVDPQDPDRVWAGGVNWFRSDDGGRNWGLATFLGAGKSFAHADQHAIAFHPQYDGSGNQVALIGTDGGVFRTVNARAPVAMGFGATCGADAIGVEWHSLNRDYAVTQFYHGMVFPDGTRVLGGSQDNGTLLGGDAAGINGWRGVFGGDGGYVAIDSANPEVFFVETQWAGLLRSIPGQVNSFTAASIGLDPVRSSDLGPESNYLFITPFVMDPADSRRLWLGGEYLYRTATSGESWVKASAQLPDGSLSSALAVAVSDSSRVISGTNKGHILFSREALRSSSQTVWSASRPRDGWVTSVAFDPRNSDRLYATYGNFGGQHVFRSDNGGVTWESLDGIGDDALPDIPVHCLVIDPDDPARIYLATDLGVLVSVEGGGRWLAENSGFGPVVTEWLALHRDASGRKRLFAFTHGRGVWVVNLE